MKQGWGIKRIVDVAEKIFAGGDKPKLFSETETDILRVPVYANGVTNNGLCGYTDKCTVEQKCITVSARGTIGFCCIRDTPFVPIVRLITIIPSKDVDLKYLYYAIGNSTISNSGTSIPQLTVPMIREILIPVPPIAEQQRIVEILDREFEKIDALKANTERNLQHAKDLFKSNLKCIFSGNNKALGDVLNLRRGYDLTHSEMIEGDIPVAGSGGIIGYHNVATNITPCITVGRSGSVGKIHIYNTCWAHNTVLYIDDFKGNSPYYLYYLLISLDLSKKGSGCGVPTLNRNYLHPIIIGFSENVSEQEQIVSLLDKLSEHCKALEENYTKTIALCDDMKQALLRQAFNGEL